MDMSKPHENFLDMDEVQKKLSAAILAALLSMPETDMIQAMKDWTLGSNSV